MYLQAAGGGVVERAVSAVTMLPVVATLVVASVAVLAGVLVRRYRRGIGHEFRAAVADCDDGLAVLTHPNPDPDALATGLAVVHLADTLGVDATLQYPGEIRHQENRALRRALDLGCEPIGHVSEIAHESVVLVDHSDPRGFAGAEGVLPYAVLDHHADGDDPVAERFVDVRPEYGATASILAEYFSDLGATPVGPDRDPETVGAELTVPSEVATALMLAILTDTDDLVSGTAVADFDAAGYLHSAVDESLLRRIGHPQVSAGVLEAKARAIADRQVDGAFAVSHVGTVPHPDAVPQAADELILLEGTTAAVVCGETDGVMYLSGRSRDERVHMGRVMETVVDPYRGGEGGGHARMGGAQIPLAPGPGEHVRTTLVDQLFETLDGAETVRMGPSQ
jgi:nanoRNase/pAp phosphatase (c-di-AMP/oligoRNAs hydrolase)